MAGSEADAADAVVRAMQTELARVVLPVMKLPAGTLDLVRVELLCRDGLITGIIPGFHTSGGTPDPRRKISSRR
jgi:hypothetical protein